MITHFKPRRFIFLLQFTKCKHRQFLYCLLCVCVLQEAVRYYNQTTLQLQMLEFSRQRLVSDDEVSSVCLCITGGYLWSGEGKIMYSTTLKQTCMRSGFGLGCLQLCLCVTWKNPGFFCVVTWFAAVQCGPCFYKVAISQMSMGWQHDTGISLSYYDAAQGLWPSGQPNINQITCCMC